MNTNVFAIIDHITSVMFDSVDRVGSKRNTTCANSGEATEFSRIVGEVRVDQSLIILFSVLYRSLSVLLYAHSSIYYF